MSTHHQRLDALLFPAATAEKHPPPTNWQRQGGRFFITRAAKPFGFECD
jgi:hypothetical protein